MLLRAARRQLSCVVRGLADRVAAAGDGSGIGVPRADRQSRAAPYARPAISASIAVARARECSERSEPPSVSDEKRSEVREGTPIPEPAAQQLQIRRCARDDNGCAQDDNLIFICLA